jgi:uncharacterized repeat protein (TIGR01451 family)
VGPGETVTFTMTVTAGGDLPAEDVEICDRLPSAFTPVSLGGGRVRGGRICWTVGALGAGSSRTVRVVARASAGTTRRVTNVATVTAADQPAQRARARVRVLGLRGACPAARSAAVVRC